MTDDDTFGAAKLRESIRGQLNSKENTDHYLHTGLVEPGSTIDEILSFVESIYDPDSEARPTRFSETSVAKTLRRRCATDYVGAGIKYRAAICGRSHRSRG